jgi:hypothetical protein
MSQEAAREQALREHRHNPGLAHINGWDVNASTAMCSPTFFSCPHCGATQHLSYEGSRRLCCRRYGPPLEDDRPTTSINCRGSFLLILVLAVFGSLSVSRAQSTAKPAGLPPVHSFDETTIPQREFRAKFERSLAQRAKDIGLPPASYDDVVAQVAQFVEMCESLTDQQLAGTQTSSLDRDGKPFYFPPRIQLLEGGKYKDCSKGRVFAAPANGKEITFQVSMSNWDTQQRKFNGPKLHVWAYFKVAVPGPPMGEEEYGKHYGILNAEIYDGTTPASAPPAKSIAEIMREGREGSRPRTVIGEYVCPGTELRVVVRNEVFNTYVDFNKMTVKKPALIARTDQTGVFFQQGGSGNFYYQIISGRGSQKSCSQ